MSWPRVMAIVRKELQDYRRNRYILFTMTLIPVIFLLQPLIYLLGPAAASVPLSHRHELVYLLGIPVLAPSFIAASSVVMERQQGTLEPVLATPIRRQEFVLAKALAPLLPSVIVSYFVYGLFVAVIEVFAHPGVASALLKGPEIVIQVVFTPFLALWSIWVGIAVSTRMADVRAAQQLSVLANIPLAVLVSLIAFDTIQPTKALVLGLGVALLVVDRLGWRVVSALFDRERLITGSRSVS
jgi:ABC-2 type transport system permease protein